MVLSDLGADVEKLNNVVSKYLIQLITITIFVNFMCYLQYFLSYYMVFLILKIIRYSLPMFLLINEFHYISFGFYFAKYLIDKSSPPFALMTQK